MTDVTFPNHCIEVCRIGYSDITLLVAADNPQQAQIQAFEKVRAMDLPEQDVDYEMLESLFQSEISTGVSYAEEFVELELTSDELNELDGYLQYSVNLSRLRYGVASINVDAESRNSAVSAALDKAGDYSYQTRKNYYEVMSIEAA